VSLRPLPVPRDRALSPPPARTDSPETRRTEVFPLLWLKCGGKVRVIAVTNEAMTVGEILSSLGEPT
jgi:hypothetical protein